MLRMKIFLMIIVTIVFTSHLFISCTEGDALEEKIKNQYVFFEKFSLERGEVISGSYDSSIVIDFPTYSFDEEKGELRCYLLGFNVDEKLKVIYGNGGCLSGAAGGGCGSSLTGIFEFPRDENELIFNEIDESGNLYLNYKNLQIKICSGYFRLFVDTTISVQDSGSARIITETKLMNYGFQQKSKIYKY